MASIGSSGLDTYRAAMGLADSFRSGEEEGIARAERKAAFDQQFRVNELNIKALRREDDRAESAAQIGIFKDMGLVGNDLGEITQSGFNNMLANDPARAQEVILNVMNNSTDVLSSPTGARFDSMTMGLGVIDPETGEQISMVDMFSPGAQQQAQQFRDQGYSVNTVFSFSGANEDGSPAVLTEDGGSDTNANVLSMTSDELFRNFNLAYKENFYYKGGAAMAQYEELQGNINSSNQAVANVAKQRLAHMDHEFAKFNSIQRLKNHFAENGQLGAVRAITGAAVKYGENSPEFNETIKTLAQDLKADMGAKNAIVLDATSDAASELKLYKSAKEAGKGTNVTRLADSVATASPDDELSIAYSEAVGSVNNAGGELLSQALENATLSTTNQRGRKSYTLAGKYGNKAARLAEIEAQLNRPDARRNQRNQIVSGSGLTGNTRTRLEKERVKLTKELEGTKIALIDDYIAKNPDVAGAGAYLEAKEQAQVAATHIAAAAEIADYSNPASLLEAINDGSLKIGQDEISAHQKYLQNRGVTQLSDVAALPQNQKMQTLANLMFLEQNDVQRKSLMDAAVKEMFPDQEFSEYSKRTNAVIKSISGFENFGSLISDIESKTMTAFDYSWENQDLDKDTRKERKNAQAQALTELRGTGSGDGALDKLNDVIRRVGNRNTNVYDPAAFQAAVVKEREIIAQMFRLHTADELNIFERLFTSRSDEPLGSTASDALVYINGRLNYVDATGQLIGDDITEKEFMRKMRISRGAMERTIEFAKENTRIKFPETAQ